MRKFSYRQLKTTRPTQGQTYYIPQVHSAHEIRYAHFDVNNKIQFNYHVSETTRHLELHKWNRQLPQTKRQSDTKFVFNSMHIKETNMPLVPLYAQQ